jgi:hypothetical protein
MFCRSSVEINGLLDLDAYSAGMWEPPIARMTHLGSIYVDQFSRYQRPSTNGAYAPG